jgi:membrane-bound inhibitor of C-type lysozyme
MIIQTILRASLLSIILIITGYAQLNLTSSTKELKVLGGEQLTYQCENENRIKVKYYSLSDSSLDFMKLWLQNEPEITLARTVSASGERYSNESLEWSTKGSSAFLQVRNQDQKWQFLYKDCQVDITTSLVTFRSCP